MPVFGTRVLLVATSFAPLWLGLGLLEIFGAGRAAWPFFGLAAASPVALAVYMRAGKRIASREITISRARRRDDAVLSYVATYLVPFAVGTSGGTGREQAAIALFVLLVIGLSVHARLYYVHPLLAIAGYHVWDIELASGQAAVLMAKRVLIRDNSQILARPIDAQLFIQA